MTNRVTKTAAGLAILFGLTLATEVQAQNPRKKNVIKLGEFKIEGTIQKPQAFYILQRSSLNFEGLELKNSFVPKILRSVEQAPF
jgi:hypothetical protein